MENIIMTLGENAFYAIVACVVFIVLDILCGFIAAIKNKALKSEKMREGLYHKSALIMIMVTAYALEYFLPRIPEVGISAPVFLPACAFIVVMEITSIVENIIKIYPELAGSKLIELFPKEDKEQ